MRKLLAVMTAVLLVTGCTSETPAQQSEAKGRPATITVIVDPQAECQPKGAPGNCWLPLFDTPVLGDSALNSTPQCNNTSRDQSSCWPQPGTKLTAKCVRNSADGRPWYGFEVPRSRITNKVLIADQPDDKVIYGYAAATHFTVTSGNIGDLEQCSN